MSTEELFRKVEQWGDDKGIDNPYRQLNKVLEEIGELAHSVCRDEFDTPEFRDAVGDSLVTIILLAHIAGADPIACLEEAYGTIAGRDGETKDGMFVKEEDLTEHEHE